MTANGDETRSARPTRRAVVSGFGAGAAALVAGCSGLGNLGDTLPGGSKPQPEPDAATTAALPPAAGAEPGKTKIGLILPLTASGNAGAAAQAMRNAAEMALADFSNPDVQLIVKDDGGTAQGAQAAVRQAIEEGAQIILGPLFAHAVTATAPVARASRIPIIAFSTDSNVATRGVFLLSFLPESDVERIVDYAIAQGKRSFVALVPDNAYGSVVEAAFKQLVPAKGGRVFALERYRPDDAGMQGPVRQIAQAASRADALFIPDSGDAVPRVARLLEAAGVSAKRLQVLGTGLWDDPRIFSDAALEGGWFAAPDSKGYKAFATRYRSKFGQDPVRTATLAYDAVALVAAIAKSQPGQPITSEMLTNPSGFSGIDGVFRFRADGTIQRGLAIHKVTPSGGEVISGAPKNFG
ncbi:MAG TPA: penicillin-binding protein activator [Rhodoplanes sp.]|nr:penicillin-binding protein activator [Rhodoplanes sp.]